MIFLAAKFADRINAQTTPSQQRALARHAGKCVGLRLYAMRFVWRIDGAGKLSAVSSFIDADVRVCWRDATEGVRVDGDAAMLRVLSDIFADTDWMFVVASVFGPVAAPRLLYAFERIGEVLRQRLRRQTVDAEEVANYGDRVRRLRDDVGRLARAVARFNERRTVPQ